MKQSLFFTFLFSIIIYCTYAQNDKMYIIKDQKVVATYNIISEIDSIIFYKPDIKPVEPEIKNLIKDASFEESSALWKLLDGNSSVISGVARTGSRSLKIISDGAQGNHVVQQTFIPGVIPGTEYKFTAWVQGNELVGEGQGGKPLAILRWRNASNTIIAKEMYMWAPYGSYDWRELSTHMQAPPDATQADVIFRAWYGCLSGISFWDDVDLRPRDFSYRGNLTGTYDVSNSTDKTGGTIATTEINYSGSGYFDSASDGAFVEWNNVSASSAGKYILSVRYAIEGNEQIWEFQVNGQSRTFRPRATGMKNSWATHDEEFDLNPGNNTVRVTIKKVIPGANPSIDRLDVYEKKN